MMATADEYADWIVKNADKRGTPEFDTVAAAYQEAKASEAKPNPAERDSLGRQIGLTARAGVNAAVSLPALFSDAIGGVMNAGLDLAGVDPKYRAHTLGSLAGRGLGAVGIPEPRNETERIAQQGASMMGGTGLAAGVSKNVAGLVASPMAKDVFTRLGADPLMQVVSAGAAGAAGQQAKESGAGWGGQLVSSLGGGLLGAGAVGGGRATVEAVKNAMPARQQINAARAEQVINLSLQRSGIDPLTITPAMRTSLREQVKKALNLGEVDNDAVARLADYLRVGANPTRGKLTLDPFDITQEMNAAKMGAALGMTESKLPTIANENNRRLLARVDEFNPTADSFLTGSRAMAPILSRDKSMEAAKTAAYGQAEGMAGGSIPLVRGPFMDAIYQRLNSKNLIRHVPGNVQSMLDDISQGVVKVQGRQYDTPFDVRAIDSLKSLIATEQRSASGSAKMALAEIRKALDEVPIEPIKRQFGGSQLVTQAGAEHLRAQDASAAALKAQLDKARQSNYEWMRWRESAPGIEAAVDGANPETFVRDFIRNTRADVRDVAKVAQVINSSPASRYAVRQEIVQYLKDGAIGKGNESATGNFSGRGWLSALNSINERKLALFFDPPEIEMLRSIGRVGTVETFQPRGSAVNNSNTAAGLAGALQGILKFAKPVADKVPFGSVAVTTPLQHLTFAQLQRSSSNLPRGLLTSPQTLSTSLDPAMLPMLTGAGLLTAPLGN